jgi:hypothetical protein
MSFWCHIDKIIWYSAQFGGSGGGPFNDTPTIITHKTCTVQELGIWFRNETQTLLGAVAAIETTCKEEVTLGPHGDKNQIGYDVSITLSEGESLVKMEGTTDVYLRSLKFTTSLGRVIAIGPSNAAKGPSFNVMMPNYGYEIVGFFGRKGALIDAIGAIAQQKLC